MRRRIVTLACVALLTTALAEGPPASAHQGEHPGVDMAVTLVFLTGNGHVTASGWATCPIGESWGVGFHVYEDPVDPSRETGMASLSAPVHPVVCDGVQHSWTAESNQIYNGGVRTTGQKRWAGKVQWPSSGDWVHKDTNNNGTVTVTAGAPPPPPTQSADIVVTKTDSADPISTMESVTYTITVTNAGGATAAGVTLTDDFRGGAGFLVFGTATASQGICIPPLVLPRVQITCLLGDIGGGASATVTLVVIPLLPGSIVDTASATTSTPEANTANNSDTETTTVSA